MFGAIVLFLSICTVSGQEWTTDDFSLFDLVEEVNNENFYTLFGISQDATTSEVKKAYRKLSLQWHPDKNSAENAEEKFRQIAAIHDVLRNAEMRKKYDDVLEFGLPDWRQPIFYYRSVRKMPWWELGAIVVVLVTVCQYLMLWGAYFEKKLTMQASIDRLRRKEKKLKKENIDVEDLIDEMYEQQLDRPTFRHLLPYTMSTGTVYCIRSAPSAVKSLIEYMKNRNKPPEPEEEDDLKPKRQAVYIEEVQYSMATDGQAVSYTQIDRSESANSKTLKETKKKNATEWPPEELALLIRLTTSKFPVGTPNRWEQIADVLERKPEHVTAMVGKMKHMDPNEYQKLSRLASLSLPASQSQSSSNGTVAYDRENCDNPPSAGGGNNSAGGENIATKNSEEDTWSQSQQRNFEEALKNFPKGVEERWERIAECVPGKSKDDCVLRFKQLAAMVRQRKVVPK